MDKSLVYVLAASSQCVANIWFFFELGEFLDEKYPIESNWNDSLLPLSLVVSAYIFYLVIRRVGDFSKPPE